VANSELDDPEIEYEHTFDADSYRSQFIEAMDDDFNTAQAIATLFDLTRDINRASEEGYSVAPAQKALLELASILGLSLKPLKEPHLDAEPFIKLQDDTISTIRRAKLDKLIDEVGKALKNPVINTEDVKPYINWMNDIRTALRKQKQFKFADVIRAELDKRGIILEDTPWGTEWKYRR